MIAEREALRKGVEHLTVSFPTVVSSFDFQVENSGRTVQYKLNAQSLRLFGLHRRASRRCESSPKQQNNSATQLSFSKINKGDNSGGRAGFTRSNDFSWKRF